MQGVGLEMEWSKYWQTIPLSRVVQGDGDRGCLLNRHGARAGVDPGHLERTHQKTRTSFRLTMTPRADPPGTTGQPLASFRCISETGRQDASRRPIEGSSQVPSTPQPPVPRWRTLPPCTGVEGRAARPATEAGPATRPRPSPTAHSVPRSTAHGWIVVQWAWSSCLSANPTAPASAKPTSSSTHQGGSSPYGETMAGPSTACTTPNHWCPLRQPPSAKTKQASSYTCPRQGQQS